MRTPTTQITADLQKVLWACYDYWRRESVPKAERAICYTWVVTPYQDRFGASFHQSALDRLTTLGFLEKDDTSRGGNRRYYKLVDPTQLESLLTQWGLS